MAYLSWTGPASAFVPVSIAAPAGVAEHEAGLASGLINTPQQLGGVARTSQKPRPAPADVSSA